MGHGEAGLTTDATPSRTRAARGDLRAHGQRRRGDNAIVDLPSDGERSTMTTPTSTVDPRPPSPSGAATEVVAGSPHPEAALRVEGLTVRYGAVVAVNNVDLSVARGSITGLIGLNGAGKTTFIDALSGFVPATGAVYLRDRVISALPPHRRQRLGVARTFQSLELFDDLTVVENMVANCTISPWDMVRDVFTGRPGRPPRFVEDLLDLLKLRQLRDERVNNLSHGHRKIVSIARAMASQPSVLLLDEPAAGLDSSESRWFGEQLRSVVRSGISVLLVEHDMDLVLSTCDHLYVLDFGTLIAQGTADQVSRDPKVIAAYLGGPADTATRSTDERTDQRPDEPEAAVPAESGTIATRGAEHA